MNKDFAPGSVIVAINKDGRHAKRGRYTVADPVRTSGGKLRLINENGNLTTTWWRNGSLPPRFKLVSVPFFVPD